MIARLYGKSMLSFVRNYQTVFQSGCTTILFPQAMNDSSCCSIFLPAFDDVRVPDFGHSNRCVMVSHCFFNVQFPNDI